MKSRGQELGTVAVVDDDPAHVQLMVNALQRAGYTTVSCANAAQAIEAAHSADLMLLDVRLPDRSGLEVLPRIKESNPSLLVILLTAYIDLRDAVSAIKQGALDYLEKPIDLDELIAAVDDAMGIAARQTDDAIAVPLPSGVIAESSAMRDVFAQAARAAQSDASVLLLGESGTGKEVVARYIHDTSPRASAPFVRVNCPAIPETLVESELFGHEKGSFTGADARREGRFEEAHLGTLFLDEIGDLPAALQPKLLHVLENGSFRRIGANKELFCDVRVIAATNRNLTEAVLKQTFREDLYFRLNVLTLLLPPLRERRDDILPAAEVFLSRSRKRLSPAAERVFMEYSWPGNLRELRNAIERASIMAAGNLILPTDLPPAMQNTIAAAAEPARVLVGDMNEIQRRAIFEALEKTGGNKTRAAALLNISRRNLFYKLREYGL